MDDQARATLRDLGVAPGLVSLLPDDVPFVLKDSRGTGDNLPTVAAGHDCQAALYLARTRIWVALDPDDAERYSRLTGCSVAAPRNRTTCRLIVRATTLDGGDRVRHLRDAVALAVRRSHDRPAASVAADPEPG